MHSLKNVINYTCCLPKFRTCPYTSEMKWRPQGYVAKSIPIKEFTRSTFWTRFKISESKERKEIKK